jgi:hypothetical protein
MFLVSTRASRAVRIGVPALAAVLFGVAAEGCGTGSSSATPAGRCVDRLMSGARHPVDRAHRSAAERYARRTYCEPFADNGWVYADGTLSIEAQEWLVHGRRCATSQNGRAQMVPCEQVDAQSTTIDCAMLHFVRRSEVQTYLRHVGGTQCDDGTPFDELGA